MSCAIRFSIGVFHARSMPLYCIAVFALILVEMDGHSPAKDAVVHQRLVAAGHRHLHELTILHSRVYMRRGVIDDKWLHRWLSSLPPSSPPPHVSE